MYIFRYLGTFKKNMLLNSAPRDYRIEHFRRHANEPSQAKIFNSHYLPQSHCSDLSLSRLVAIHGIQPVHYSRTVETSVE